jgi:fructokinase
LPAADVAQAVLAGDPTAIACYRVYVGMLARALATVINVVDPFAIVLGGGMSNIETLYGDVVACWDQYVFSDRVDTRLVPAKYGDSSGVRGAAWLWHGQ